MAQTIRKVPIKGISSISHTVGGVTTDLGPTAQDGVTVEYGGSNLDTYSGQSTGMVSSEPVTRTITITIRHLAGDLRVKRYALGLPASAHTGDLQGGPPTAEVLAIRQNELGTLTGSLTITSPGPKGPRTKVFALVKAVPQLTEVNAQGANIQYESRWVALDPQDGSALEVDTDAP